MKSFYNLVSCDGRVVKALDLKSNGSFPRRFESCSQRRFHVLRPLFLDLMHISSIWYQEPG